MVIVCGENYAQFIVWDGKVWGLGHDKANSLTSKGELSNLPCGVTSISMGNGHSHYLDDNGCVWSYGTNNYGQLGLGDCNTRIRSRQIETLPKIVSVSASATCFASYFSLFLDEDGYVWSCGANEKGELGLGFNGFFTYIKVPQKIPTLAYIKEIAAACNFSLFLDFDGVVRMAGAIQGMETPTPIKLKQLPKIRTMSAKQFQALFLDEEGSVWKMMNDGDFQYYRNQGATAADIQLFTEIPPISAISCGYYHILLLDFDGKCWSSGLNYSGELGVGDKLPRPAPIQITEELPLIQSISAGYSISYFQDVDGYVWSCGNNGRGQLGHVARELSSPRKIEILPPLASATRSLKTKSARNRINQS